MNVPTMPSAALPPLPPSNKGELPPAAMTVIKVWGGLKSLRRARRMNWPMQTDSELLACMPNHSNRRNLASRYAAVMPPRADVPFPNFGAVNVANVRIMNTLRGFERPVRSHPKINTEAIHHGKESAAVKDVSPHTGAGDASQAWLPSRSHSSSRFGTSVTIPTTVEPVTDVDAMSWCAAGEEIATSHTGRNPSERRGLGVDSQGAMGSTWIEETLRPTLDEYSPIRPLPNVGSRHELADFGSGTSMRESAARDTSQEHLIVANQALEVQAGYMLNWKAQHATNCTHIRTNDCERPLQATEVGFVSGNTYMTVVRNRSTIQTTTIASNGTATFAGTDDGSATRGFWGFGEDRQTLANHGSSNREYDCFLGLVAEAPARPKRGRKRGFPRFPARKASLERTAKRLRATPPIWDTHAPSDEDMVVCTDIVDGVDDTPPRLVPCFPPRDITCSTQEEHEAAPSMLELDASDKSINPGSSSSITNPEDDTHDFTIWSEENEVEEPVIHTRKRVRVVFREADVMHGVTIGGEGDRTARKRARNGFSKAGKHDPWHGEEDMWDIPSKNEVDYSVREREQNAYWEAEEFVLTQRDIMHGIASESEEESDLEWDHGAIRDAEVYDSTDREEDMHDITNTIVEDVFLRRDQYTFREPEVSSSAEADVMHDVTSGSEVDSVAVTKARSLGFMSRCRFVG